MIHRISTEGKVFTAQVKLQEWNIHSRFAANVERATPMTIISPPEMKDYPINRWSPGDHGIKNNYHEINRYLNDPSNTKNVKLTFPGNIRSRYVVKRKRRTKQVPSIAIMIEAHTFCHWKELIDKGWDDKPVLHSESSAIFTGDVRQAELYNYFHMKALISYTSFDEATINLTRNDGPSPPFFHPYFAFCLIDLQNGKIHYNHFDNRFKGFLQFFFSRFKNEEIEHNCKEFATKGRENIIQIKNSSLELLYIQHGVFLDELCEELHEDTVDVSDAFKELEREGKVKIKEHPKYGMYIARRT